MKSSLDVVMIAMAPVSQQTFLALYVPNSLEVLFKLVFHISLHQPSRYFSRSTPAFIISGYFLHRADMQQQPTPIFETGITSMHVGLSHCFHIISIDNYGNGVRCHALRGLLLNENCATWCGPEKLNFVEFNIILSVFLTHFVWWMRWHFITWAVSYIEAWWK